MDIILRPTSCDVKFGLVTKQKEKLFRNLVLKIWVRIIHYLQRVEENGPIESGYLVLARTLGTKNVTLKLQLE